MNFKDMLTKRNIAIAAGVAGATTAAGVIGTKLYKAYEAKKAKAEELKDFVDSKFRMVADKMHINPEGKMCTIKDVDAIRV